MFSIHETKVKVSRDKCNERTKNIIESYLKRRDSLPTISAIYRVRNGEVYIEMAILSIITLCREVVIVDNGSTDNTISIVTRLKNELKDVCDIQIFQYKADVAIAGDDYKKECTKKVSLAEFYNYAFSLGKSDYLMKCDAHSIYTPAGIEKIQNKISQKRLRVAYRGTELYGLVPGFEYFIFKNDASYTHVDDIKHEKLTFENSMSRLESNLNCIRMPCFIHMKRINYVKYIGDSNLIRGMYKVE